MPSGGTRIGAGRPKKAPRKPLYVWVALETAAAIDAECFKKNVSRGELLDQKFAVKDGKPRKR